MFDVSWNDPSKETVGQRKQRKGSQTSGVSRGSSVRSSQSSASKSSKSGDSALSIPNQTRFGGFSLFSASKKGDFATGSITSQEPFRAEAEKHAKRLSTYNPSQELDTCRDYPRCESTDNEGHSDDSIFSGRRGRAGKPNSNTNSTWSGASDQAITGQIIQPLNENSYITQSTEVTLSRRDNEDASQHIATVVQISSAGTIPVEIVDSSKSSTPSETFEFPVSKSQLAQQSSGRVLREDIQLSPKGWPIATRNRKVDTWQPPDTWDCPTSPTQDRMHPKSPTAKSSRTRKSPESKPATTDLTHLRRSIRRMEAAGFKIMLERLKEEWQEVADPSVYRELELEKQLWMLCAVRSLNKQVKTERTPTPFLENPLGSTKVLSLYENHASASLLSALLEGPEVHHFSPNPVSPRSFPNIHPLAVPSPTATLPYASSIFSSIRALSLSVQLPASSLPGALKECHRIMISGGSLHLTILDPSPITSTLGPCLRTWLDNYLLLNLERQFRCINPSRLFPIWLTDAGLRGEGSTITTARFLACPLVGLCSSHSSADNLQMKGNLRDSPVDGKQISPTKHELQTQVGRMLWRELWGSFAQGERWWWDDEAIVEECERMGTAWEYSIIEAIKR